MGSQVEKGAAALGKGEIEFPVLGGNHTVTVEMVVELNNTTQGTLRDELLEGNKVGIPSSVLVDDKKLAILLSNIDELISLRRGGHKGLLGQDMLSGLEGGLCELKVVVGRSADDDQIDFRVGKKRLVVSVVLDIRVVSWRRVALLGRSLDNGVQLELGSLSKEGDVKDLGRHAIVESADDVVKYCGWRTYPYPTMPTLNVFPLMSTVYLDEYA
ncbi:hypothetical protein HG530_000289 [Fusarium avenaceum]|nr:hypothetical protein HG530_000289 [Fusarium avenaceum]